MLRWLFFNLLSFLVLGGVANAQLYSCKSSKKDSVKSFYSSPPEDLICTLLPSYSDSPQKNKSQEKNLPIDPLVNKPSAGANTNVLDESKTKHKKSYKIPKTTQKQRDQKRQEILLHELFLESRRLKLTEEAITQSNQDDVQKQQILQHQKLIYQNNITALKQELSRLDIHVDYPSH